MNKIKKNIKFNININEKFLCFFSFFVVFVFILTLTFFIKLETSLRYWGDSLMNEITVQVIKTKNESITLEEKVDNVIGFLSSQPTVDMARELSSEEIDEMMEPWLLMKLHDLNIEIPTLISVKLKEKMIPDDLSKIITSFKEELDQKFKNVSVYHHSEWNDPLTEISDFIHLFGTYIFLGFLAVMSCFILFMSFLFYDAQKLNLRLIYRLGASQSTILQKFNMHIIRIVGLGGGLGFLCALFLIYYIAFKLEGFSFIPLFSFLPSDLEFLALIFIPLSLIFLIAFISQLIVKQMLFRNPHF